MSEPRRVAPLLGLALLGACAAPGTDFEALPFYREDRTQEPVVSVDIPLLLLNFDAADLPPRSPDEPNGEAPPADAAPIGTVTEPHLSLRFPWPLGLWIRSGTHHNFSLTTLIAADTARNSGPLGRALSSQDGVSKNLIPAFGSDPEPGGIISLPLSFYDTLVDHGDLPDVEGQDLDRDIGLLPLFAYGSGSDEKHDYLAVFPFGGTTKGILGKEEITWYGFPLAAYMKVKDRAYESTHIAWPFYNSIEGPRHQGWRILPFYGHYEHQDSRGRPVYERTFIMWPFFTSQTLGMNEPAGPTSVFFSFPFFGRISGPERENVTVLWPFFRWEEDDRARSWELRAPFPFLILGGGEDRYRFDLWPLFGVKGRSNYDRQFLVWPLFRHEALESEQKDFSGLWLLPFFWRTHWDDKDTGTDETRLRVYPLLHWRKMRDGSADLALLSPWWTDDPAGFERIIGPLLRLYRWHRDPDGGTQHQLLFGLASLRGIPASERRQEYDRVSLLFGLFHWRQLGSEHGLRLFWLPEITWGGEP